MSNPITSFVKAKTVSYEYEYKNRQTSNVSIWMALPPNTATQQVRSVQYLPDPVEENELFSQTVGFYQLAAGESIKVKVELDLYRTSLNDAKGQITPLTDGERNFYLRSTHLCPVNKELRGEARKIIGTERDQLSITKRLFEHFHKTYTYKSPPEKRGALHFKEAGKGDCGEFSFLFSSYMRSLGIPCRTVVGAFLHKFKPHAWNEVWLEKYGWLPVDTSMAAMLKKPLSHYTIPLQMGERSSKEHYFGNFEGKRVIFSLDADWPLTPAYIDAEPPEQRELVVFGKEIAYGFHSLDGAAPYLQPIYTQFTHNPNPEKLDDLLGTWNIKEQNLLLNIAAIIKKVTYLTFLVAMLLYALSVMTSLTFLENLPLGGIGYIAAAIGLLAAVLRKEANWHIYVLFAFVLGIGVTMMFT